LIANPAPHDLNAQGELMHSVGEHVHVDDLATAAKVYLDVALNICSQPAD
jgi:acetylornithine deacetylase/succinyl-diaminopimelate desuccinylase-like protein